jgi:hypothetical protein
MTEAQLEAVMDDVRAAIKRPEFTIAVARSESGRPLAFAAAVIDDMACLLRGAVATSHEARWALHDHLVRILIARRVRYLLADGGGPFGALGVATNVQHYQHLLGYELRHVVPAGTRNAARSRFERRRGADLGSHRPARASTSSTDGVTPAPVRTDPRPAVDDRLALEAGGTLPPL